MRNICYSVIIILFAFLLVTCGTENKPIYTLTTSLNGDGTISPSSGEYEEGETVLLTGHPSNGWEFVRWEGDWSSTQNPSTITMIGNKNIIGVFERLEYPLTITTEGKGTVEKEVIQAKTTDYPFETVIKLTSIPANGWEFIEWSGDVESTNEVIEITIKGETNISVLFEFNGRDTETTVVDVTNPITGKTWMDRNLGASQAAISATDEAAYGDLYQWGRLVDGHQKRSSSSTAILSSSNQPDHGNFIVVSNEPYDWRKPQNSNLWQGLDGTNNPCPEGYRIPSEAEWVAEFQSWSSNDLAGAYASTLRLTGAGGRDDTSGSLIATGDLGAYWSSSVNGIYSRILVAGSNNSNVMDNFRARGFSVRCIKD